MLTRTECSAMRGLAIIGIFLHNYCHWLGFAVKENEYTFTMSKASDLMQALAHPDLNLPIHLLSFFGHYGVPVFLFLSAYGLVMKYEKRGALSPKQTNVVPFLKHHYVKLFKMMIVGFVAFTMVDAITPGSHKYHVPARATTLASTRTHSALSRHVSSSNSKKTCSIKASRKI